MINRRHFLRHVGTSSLALAPFMQRMRAEAAGDPAGLPKRFVFVVRGNGLRPYGVVPEGLEEFGVDRYKGTNLVDRSLADLPLNKSMKALIVQDCRHGIFDTGAACAGCDQIKANGAGILVR